MLTSARLTLLLVASSTAYNTLQLPTLRAPRRAACTTALAASQDSSAGTKAEGGLGEWMAAGVVATSASLMRATGMAPKNDTRDDVELVADGTGQTLVTAAGATVAVKVATGVATKVAATTATVFVAGPAFKAATIGAGLLQIGIDKFRADKKIKKVALANTTRLERSKVLRQAKAEETRQLQKREATAAIVATSSRFVSILPKNPPTAPKVSVLAGVGALLGAILPVKFSTPVGAFAVFCIAFSKPLKLYHAHLIKELAKREADFAEAARNAAEAATGMKDATKELRLALAS